MIESETTKKREWTGTFRGVSPRAIVCSIRYLSVLVFLGSLLLLCGCATSSLHRGYRWYRRGAYEQSVKTFTYYLEHSSDCDENSEERAAGFFYRGLAKAEMGKGREAYSDYAEALRRVPHFFYASFNMGVWHIRQRQCDLASSMFRKSWDSVLKAGRGELDDSALWNRSVFSLDREYCFYYYGMALVLCGSIDELATLLNESNGFIFQKKNVSVAREIFQKIVSREMTTAEARLQVESWLKDVEKGRRVHME